MSGYPIVIASMPWVPVRSPSIQIATVATALARHGLDAGIAHLYVGFFEMVADLAGHDVTALEDVAPWFGEWAFAVPPFRPIDSDADRRLHAISRRIGKAAAFDLAARIRERVPAFLDRCVDELLRASPRVVGLSTTFQQNVPSLALARRLKERDPDLKIVLGGANCAGVMGPALLQAFPWVDAVVSGEAERVAGPLFAALADGCQPPEAAGVSTRDASDGLALSAASAPRASLGEETVPDYSDWFERVARSPARPLFEPAWIPYEASRGCWWADRSVCSFCGQNMDAGRYRSKAAPQVVRELRELTRRHRRTWVAFVDNIMDPRSPRDLFPALEREVPGLSLFLSTKANLTREELEAMRRGGLVMLQPGIESLSTPILRLIRKGSTALMNVQVLRDAQELGLAVYWNLLYGFPGEPPEEYDQMAALVPALVHLQPPSPPARVHLDRFSPYFSRPAEHGLEVLGPYENYAFSYGEDHPDNADLAYFFRYAHADGRDPAAYSGSFVAACEEWRRRWREGPPPVLTHQRDGDGLEIVDTRTMPARRLQLGAAATRVHLSCARIVTPERIARELALDAAGVQRCLEQLERNRLVLHEDGRWLALSVPASRRNSTTRPHKPLDVHCS
jgi:ribosomal peptide maturation radical SAM protein 1